jgi:Ino eighty subunit 2
MDTINKLLKKQAPKRRGKISAAETGGDATPKNGQEISEPEKPDPTLTRWVSSRDSCRVGVPSEWLGVPAGRVFSPENGSPIPQGTGGGKLVEEV